MSALNENAFEMLAAKDRKAKNDKSENSQSTEVSTAKSPDDVVATPTVTEGEDASWTVQSSVKTRRLVPQFSLSRQDLGSDNARNKPSTTDPQKKKVIRFTKEELLALRKPSKILSTMSEMLEVVSLTTLEPVCYDRLEPEDVVRIWNMESNRNHNRDMGGRGRGRGGRGGRGPGDEHQQQNHSHHPVSSDSAPVVSASDWNRKSTKPGPWEGGTGGGAGGLDLADFAAAALKFRSEMADMKLTDGEGVPGGVEEDMMERLLREQTAAAAGELGGALEDDDDAVPDWAMDTVSGADSLKTAPQPQAKRSLLLETLNVKSPASGGSATVTAVKSQVVAQTHTGVGGDLSLHPSAVDQLLGSRLLAALPLLPEPPVEWFYTDPQGQVQGPFSQENMQLWHEAGYFSKDLPIKLRAWAAFHPFCVVFPPAHLARGMGAFCGAPLEPQPPAAFPPMPALVANGGLALHEQQRQHQHQLYLREQQSQLEQRQAQEAQQQREQEQRARQRVEEAARQQHMASAAAKQSASGPPPLVAAPADKKAPQNAAAPVDPLRKIRISTNISELNAGSETAASQRRPAQQNQATAEPEPRKKSAASGPPPLVQDKGREGPAWAGAKESAAAGKDSVSLLDIQRIEKDRAERERMARETEARQQQIIKGKGWAGAGSAAGAAKLVTASLSDIQQEEARQRERQRAQQEAQQPAGAPLTMSSQLKSLLGVKTSGLPVGAAPAPKQWAAAGASSPVAATEGSKSNGGGGKSLREIMQQEQKQQTATPEGSGPSAAPRRQPLSWAAKAGTGVNATNLLPASITAAVQKDTAVRPVESAAVPVAKSAPAKSVPANGSGVSSGNDFGGHAMSREMSEWCSAQLRKITGSADDLSALMDFCVSLESASEIREYLSQYLGSSPQLTNFATDFIKFKAGGRKALLLDTSSSTAGQPQGGAAGTGGARKKKSAAAGGK